jgi:hypothetical protein
MSTFTLPFRVGASPFGPVMAHLRERAHIDLKLTDCVKHIILNLCSDSKYATLSMYGAPVSDAAAASAKLAGGLAHKLTTEVSL